MFFEWIVRYMTVIYFDTIRPIASKEKDQMKVGFQKEIAIPREHRASLFSFYLKWCSNILTWGGGAKTNILTFNQHF